jgi:hypothetical protein
VTKHKNIKVGMLVKVGRKVLNVKEKICPGLYQGNDIKTGALVHFTYEQITQSFFEIDK